MSLKLSVPIVSRTNEIILASQHVKAIRMVPHHYEVHQSDRDEG